MFNACSWKIAVRPMGGQGPPQPVRFQSSSPATSRGRSPRPALPSTVSSLEGRRGSQCTNHPRRLRVRRVGSWTTIKARLFAPCGTPPSRSSGEMSSPSHVYLRRNLAAVVERGELMVNATAASSPRWATGARVELDAAALDPAFPHHAPPLRARKLSVDPRRVVGPEVDVECGTTTAPSGRAPLARGARDGLLALLTERVDEELLDAAPRCACVQSRRGSRQRSDVAAAPREACGSRNTPRRGDGIDRDLTWALILLSRAAWAKASALLRRDGSGRGHDPALGPRAAGRDARHRRPGADRRGGRAPPRGFGMHVLHTTSRGGAPLETCWHSRTWSRSTAR